MTSLRFVPIGCVLIAGFACGNGKGAHSASDTVRAVGPTTDTLVLEQGPSGEPIVHGFGFVMPVPMGTTIDRKAEGGVVYYVIAGPLRPTPQRTPEQGPSEPEPIFQVNVSRAGRATPAALDVFVDSLRRANNATADSDLGQIEPAEVDSVGDRRALVLEPPCGDCAAEDRYVAAHGNVVLFGYAFGIHLAGTPAEQRPILQRLLGGVRWEH